MPTPLNYVPPNADNPDRAGVLASGNDYVVSLTGDNSRFLRADGSWAVPPGVGSVTWGSITGAITDQLDLMVALGLKANTSALAPVAFSGVYSDLTGKPPLGTVAALSYPGGTSAFLRGDGTWAIPVDVNAVWGNIGGTLSAQSDLAAALGAKAPLASPTFTGNPQGPAPALDDNTASLATTTWYAGQGSVAAPLINGAASSGSSLRWARGDHVHPTDTSRMVNPMTTVGDMIYASASGSPAVASRLARQTDGMMLSLTSGAPQWMWQNNQATFSAYKTSSPILPGSTLTEVVFDSILWVGPYMNYNNGNGRAQPNAAGKYQVNAGIYISSAANNLTYYQIVVCKNGTVYKYGNIINLPNVPSYLGSVSCLVDMNGTTDYISIWVYASGGSITIPGGGNLSFFDMTLIR
jgi:hypothetical protein